MRKFVPLHWSTVMFSVPDLTLTVGPEYEFRNGTCFRSYRLSLRESSTTFAEQKAAPSRTLFNTIQQFIEFRIERVRFGIRWCTVANSHRVRRAFEIGFF